MKGFVNTVEALIGAILILSTMIYLFSPQQIQEQDIYGKAYDCLKYAKDFSDAEVRVAQCLPATYQFKLCTDDCTVNAQGTVIVADYIEQGKITKLWVYK